MTRFAWCRSALSGLAAAVLLAVGVAGCGGDPADRPLRLSGPSAAEEGDTVWVDVAVDETMARDVSDVQFQLHYTTAHLEGLRHKLGAGVRRTDASVQHYPSKASFDLGVSLADAGEPPNDGSLLRVQFRVKETAPRGIPSHLRLADLELLRDDGTMRRLTTGDSLRMAIRSAGEQREDEAVLAVGDQYTIMDTVTVGEVVAPDSARILVRGTTPGGTEAVVARRDVSPGRHQNLRIGIDPAFNLDEKRFAFLEAGLYRVSADGADASYRRFQNDGTPVQATFTAHYRTSTPESEIIVRNKPLDNHTLVVDSVFATEPADLVIHRNDRNGGPLIPGVIGKTPVETGMNENVAIDIFDEETVVCGETLWPMLHVRSESADQPYEIDYPIITEPVTIKCG